MKENIKKYAYPCCLSILLTFAIITMVDAYYAFYASIPSLAITSIICTLLLHIFDCNKKRGITYVVLGLLIAGTILLLIQFDISIIDTANQLVQFILTVLVDETSDDSFMIQLALDIMIFLLTILNYVLQKKYAYRLVIAVASVIILIILSLVQQPVSKLGVSCLITYDFIILVEFRLSCFYKNKKDGSTATMTFLLPFIFLVTITLAAIPASKQPMQWKTAKYIIHKITSSIDQIFNSIDLWMNPEKTEFGLNFTGYSEDGTIGGSLSDSNTQALTLFTQSLITSNIYLSGSVKSEFDGSEWTQTQEEFSEDYPEWNLDILELMYAISRSNMVEKASDLVYYRPLTVRYEDINTKTFFYPLKLVTLMNKKSNKINDIGVNLRFNDVMSSGTEYSFYYEQMNLGSENMDRFLSKQTCYQYSTQVTDNERKFRTQKKGMSEIRSIPLPDNLEAALNEYSEYVNAHYTDTYEGLPQRVRDLAIQVTKDYSTDYEKVKALEQMLSLYTYTTTPKEIPEGEDIVDYLLFESKKGYCTYYATALAMLARCIGVPSRYVQGFCVTIAGQEKRFEYKVYNRNAHAWVECYFKGVGWIPFEPTPSFKDKRYQPWTSKKMDYSGTDIIDMEPDESMDVEGAEQIVDNEGPVKKHEIYRKVIIIAFLVILSICVAIVVYLKIVIHKKKERYEKYSLSQKVYSDMEDILFILKELGLSLKPNETIRIFLERVDKALKEHDINMTSVADCYMRLRYHAEDMTEQDCKSVRSMRVRLEEIAKVETVGFQYLWLQLKLKMKVM